MPLQQRDFREATDKIKETAVANVRRKIGNSNYWCIVSAGAPGIEEWGDVHFEYLYMNFGNGFYLSGYDSELKLEFSNNQKLFLYLHIDEFQMIDKWGAQNKTNQFFGNMIRCITKFTTEEYSTFIQPFLSGTAPRAIAKQREVTGISFQFVDCPLLDIKSMILIMDHFATKFKAPTTLLNFEAPIKKDAAPKTKGVAPPITKHVFKWLHFYNF
uniref:Uncharacterized protein n=1 Tax=Rhizophagus irregularis (strain DAOM 181602 / DAOM 197198 / MUCL 43194) TaxID=747089 RepID=U9SM92_RHIID